MGLSENVVYPMTQWFCWSLSLLNGYFIGGIPHFQTYPNIQHDGNVNDQSNWVLELVRSDSEITFVIFEFLTMSTENWHDNFSKH